MCILKSTTIKVNGKTHDVQYVHNGRHRQDTTFLIDGKEATKNFWECNAKLCKAVFSWVV